MTLKEVKFTVHKFSEVNTDTVMGFPQGNVDKSYPQFGTTALIWQKYDPARRGNLLYNHDQI